MQRRWQGRSGPDVSDGLPTITRGFSWDFRGRQQRLRVRIPMWLYAHYLARPRSPDHGIYVIDPFDDRVIEDIASAIDAYAQRNSFSDDSRVEFATQFVQHLEYVPDDVSTPYNDYPRYPVETLVHRGGDCEDASILLASILQALGEEVGLLRLPGHLQVGVVRDGSYPGAHYEHGGECYYVLEATGGGWRLGEAPPEHEGQRGEVLPLSAVPLLLHRWSAAAGEDGEVAGVVHVTNLGSASAERAVGLVQFETATGGWTGNRTWVLDGIGVAETRAFEFQVRPSSTELQAARVRLFVNGHLHDESTSPFSV